LSLNAKENSVTLAFPWKYQCGTDFMSVYTSNEIVGEGQGKFGHLSEYASIEPVHKAIHDYARKNFNYVKNGTVFDKKYTKEIVENFRVMEDASLELAKILNAMVNK